MGEEEKFLESASPCRPVGGAAKNEDDLVFPGFRFHPTDQELVEFYLTRKVEKKGFSIEIIREIDIYKHDPWDLPKWSHAQQQEGLGLGSGGETTTECYFFCLRGRKYRNSIRPNRVTGSGFWKATGIDKPIYSGTAAAAAACIGLKKSLVYYRGSAGKGTKTDWMMHEFRLPPPSDDTAAAGSPSPHPSLQEAEVWTICRIFRRNITYKKQPQQQQAAAAAIAPPDSSSITGSVVETSDSTGDEYANFLQPQAPANNVGYSQPQYHHGQHQQYQYWSSAPPPQPSPAMAAFRQSVVSPTMATANDLYKQDGCWDDISRMVMEFADDPSVFCDYRYAA